MSKTTACACRSFEFGTYDPNTEQDDTYTTECNQTTTRIFAQGHDAKLVGFLVRAELAGEEISLTDGGMRTSFGGAVNAAGRISEALAAKAQAQLDAAKARLAKAASREATKTARKSAKAAAAPEAPAQRHNPMNPGGAVVVDLIPSSRLANIKVGRWTYTARIDSATGEAKYSNKLGVAKTVARGSYQEV
jgi:hypothetical protein